MLGVHGLDEPADRECRDPGPLDRVGHRPAIEDSTGADEEERLVAAGEPVVGEPEAAGRRRETDLRPAARRLLCVHGHTDEADERRYPGDPRRERLLLVANTVGGVLGLEDRQVAVVERWSGEPLEAGSVGRKAPASDGDAQVGAVGRLGEDLAPVGDVQRN